MRFAVVPTHDRPDDFRDCVAAITPQIDYLIVVAHRCDYPAEIVAPYVGFVDEPGACGVSVLEYQPEVPNISRMWNLGIDYAKRLMGPRPHWVAVLNDDAIVPPRWMDLVVGHMTSFGCAAGSADQHNRLTYPAVLRRAEAVPLELRMAGFAFVLDGTKGIRADERMRWWYSDDMIEWTARQAGGVVLVPGVPVEHRHPNSTTVGELARISGEDRVVFENHWGKVPH